MQSLCHAGGYLDLAGFDVSTTRPVIANIQTAVTAARAAGMPRSSGFKMAGMNSMSKLADPAHRIFSKSNALKTMRKQPQLQGKIAGERLLGLSTGG